jgi:hypothetical protein
MHDLFFNGSCEGHAMFVVLTRADLLLIQLAGMYHLNSTVHHNLKESSDML